MKSLKKTLVLLVVLSMILSAVSPVFAFSDVVAEEYAEQANKMAAFGVFTGDANGNFNAEENITRAEMAVVIGRLMGLTTNEANANQNYASNFSDVAAGDWYTGWVNLVAGRGIISGFPDGTFRPNEKVTQAQAVTMIVKALGWGVVVDQTGTWPANYITKAAELRLFKDAAETNSELVTRGNVAIYCYNALTAKTWDVTSSEDGKLTSSKTADTILAKYFSDFTNEAGKMKLVESAKVASTPINDAELGINQIVLVEDKDTEYEAGKDDETIGDFINAATKGGKNKEEKTFGDETITAYVVEGACANLAALQGKLVDVIFGKNNEVVYINVVDDAETGLFVTAWDGKEEIELDGTTYEVDENATVSLFGTYVIKEKAAAAINAVMAELKVGNAAKNVERTISASIVLDIEDDELITSIDFTASEDFAGTVDAYKVTDLSKKVEIGMEQAVIKSINAKTGAIKTIDNHGTISGKTLEKLEDADVRVIKNNEIVTVEDIAEGDLVTVVTEDGDIKTILISDNKVTGTLDRIKNEVLTIDGTEYNAVNTILGNTDGDIEKIAKVTKLADDYLGEEVEVYLNFMGEVAVILTETEAVPATIGIVKDIYGTELDREARVDYLEIKVLAADGTTERYYIYHEDDEEDMKNDTIADLAIGSVIWFSADAENVIVWDADERYTEILVVADKALNIKETTVEVDGKELDVKVLGATSSNVDKDDKEVASFEFDNDTIYFNNDEDNLEIIKGWESLVKADDDTAFTAKAIVIADEDEVLFFVDTISSYASTVAEFAIVESIEDKKVDKEVKTFVTLVGVDGEFELAKDSDSKVEVNDLVKYELTDDEIKMTEVIDEYTLSKVDYEEAVKGLNTTIINETAKKAAYEVEEVKDGKVYYAEYNETELPKLSLVKTSVTVFDIEEGTVEVVDVDELDIEGKYAFGITADEDNEDKIDTLIVFSYED